MPRDQRPTKDPARLARGRFQRDVLWNLGSLAVLGASGIALNALIGWIFGAGTLGVFNQVVAAYIFFSQAAVGGLDRSVLRAVAEAPEDRARIARLVLGALLPTLALSALATALFWWARPHVAFLLESPGVAVGMAWAAPGLFFFAVNKVLLAATNGLRRMRAFAVLNALRYVLILAGLLVAIALDFDSNRLGFVFSFAECILFVPLALEVGLALGELRADGLLAWSRTHLWFGLKSAFSGMLLELNARVDVLMAGYFLDDARVGIYSFAAILAEGVFQLLVVLQNNYNPLIARALAGGAARAGAAREEFRAMVRRGRLTTYLMMLAACGLAVLGYPLYLLLVGDSPGFEQSWRPFGVLMAGMWLASGYMPFAQTLLMGGRPFWHTLMMVGIVGINVYCNALLIPLLGIVGAALGTAISLCSSAVLLRGMVDRHVGVPL